MDVFNFITKIWFKIELQISYLSFEDISSLLHAAQDKCTVCPDLNHEIFYP